MKKIVLVARQDIKSTSTFRTHDDTGRIALDGIRYGKAREIADNVDPLAIWHELKQEFEKANPRYRVDRYSIRFEDGSEIDCTDKIRMQTANKANDNYRKLAALFPNAVTETINENGEVVRAIDKDVLMQEISCTVVEGSEERYQFTWPDKKKSILLANAPTSATLRPCREESVDFDTTENLYIEGDNLDVLKLLQETYLGKIKMIYIDPPYNTGNDFVYEDNFAESSEEYLAHSGQFDAEGNRLFQNTESNGRFHTDWLNMIYPRLSLAKTLLSEEGAIFISIDDNEVDNLRKVCDMVFGEKNYIGQWNWYKSATPPNLSKKIKKNIEYVLCYEKNRSPVKYKGRKKESKSTNGLMNQTNSFHKLVFPANCVETGLADGVYPAGKYGTTNYEINLLQDVTVKKGVFTSPVPLEGRFKWSQENLLREIKAGTKIAIRTKAFSPSYDRQEYDPEVPPNLIDKTVDVDTTENAGTYLDSLFGGHHVFDYPKPVDLISYLCNFICEKDEIILDFFSGSATTAQAMMQLNAEDGGCRKFIMVQLPEKTDEKSEAYKAGYQNICEIGKERIRRAGKKILEDRAIEKSTVLHEWDQTTYYEDHKEECDRIGTLPKEEIARLFPPLDVGFRVLKLDSSNMKDVYYTPTETSQISLDDLSDNIKPDRSPEDLLFQVMLDLGILLSSKIVETEIAGKKVFDVADGFLVACFDKNVTDEVITEIARQKPYYFVTRDHSIASDSVATNFDQIFATYSPDTVRKVL